jgi:glycosyltransferase involved in cell wall biosynthesis
VTGGEVRVLHVITRLDADGSATNTVLTAHRLTPRFRSALAFGPVTRLPPLAEAARDVVELIEIPDLVRDPAPVQDVRALIRLWRIMRHGQYDLVHTHTSKAGFLGRLAARLAGVTRIVHTPHGHVFGGGYARPWLTRVFAMLERWAARHTDRIVTLTELEIRDYLALRIGRREQYACIPSGVDLDAIASGPEPSAAARARLGLPASAIVIGSVGRLEPVKGHLHLLEAFIELAPRHPALYLTILGEGPLRAALVDRAAAVGLADRVRLPGRRDDVPALLPALDAFVFPSLNEGMGRALVEAMAAGLPVVASRAGGIPEVLEDGRAGLLVDPGDPGALARGIEAVLTDAELAKRLARAARARARGYTLDEMLRRIEAMYRELLGPRGHRP